MKVSIKSTRTITPPDSGWFTGSSAYTIYLIVVEWSSQHEWRITKRFSEFDALNDILIESISASNNVKIPPLPSKTLFKNVSTSYIYINYLCDFILIYLSYYMISLIVQL